MTGAPDIARECFTLTEAFPVREKRSEVVPQFCPLSERTEGIFANEDNNGFLRDLYPKGGILSPVASVTQKRNPASINTMPRKILIFRSAQFLWDLELKTAALSMTIHLKEVYDGSEGKSHRSA